MPISKLSIECVLFWYIAAGSAIAADRVLEDTVTPTLVFRKVAVPQQGFSRQLVIDRCMKFFAENPAIKMARLTIVPDIKPATYSLIGCDHCDPYRFWRMQWDPIAEDKFAIGEMMMIEG